MLDYLDAIIKTILNRTYSARKMRLSAKSLLEDMTDIVIGKKNEVFLKYSIFEPHVFQELSEQFFTFDVPGAKFMPQYRSKYWDGKTFVLFSPHTGEIYVGLLR